MAANITKAYLLYVPFEKDYAHTLYFANAAAQQAYFMGRKKMEATGLSYQRKDGVLRWPAQMDELLKKGCNYVMYQNTAYSDKWFYAFITDLSFENPQHTNITIATDCIQTWMFDVTIKPSFVEREHTTNDDIGNNTLDEALELGEYKCNLHTKSGFMDSGTVIVLGVTKKADNTNVTGSIYEGIYSGVKYYVFAHNAGTKVNEFLAAYDSAAAGESVTCMFLAPAAFSPLYETINEHPQIVAPWAYYINHSGNLPLTDAQSSIVSMTNNDLDGYSPKNNKLLCYPYRYLLVANNCGASVPYKYEMFYKKAGNVKTFIPPEFVIEGCITPGCSIRMVPMNYNGIARNDEEGINMGKLPILNWTSDLYTNWLTQNGVNIGLQIATGAIQIGAGVGMAVATGGASLAAGGAAGIVGGVSQITNTLAQMHQQSLVPPQSKGNTNSGDVVTASGQNDFHFYEMTIKAEYARIIDGYFDMYGYKCNRVKVPAKAHRKAFWFTKTIDAAIDGAIPQGDLQTIKDAYNKGITFWRPGVTIKDYTQDNAIV